VDVNPTDWAWSQIDEKGLSAAQGLVLLAISRHSTPMHQGICWPGVATIHELCGLDYRYVRRLIQILEHRYRLLETIRCKFQKGPYTSNFYVLSLPGERPPSEILKALRRLRGNVRFDETLFVAQGKALHFGEGPQTPTTGSLDHGPRTPTAGSPHPGQSTLTPGSTRPDGEGPQTPFYEFQKEGKGGDSSLQDSPKEIHTSLYTVRSGERTVTKKDFQKFWGPVEGRLRKEIEPDTFRRCYEGCQVLSVTASEITLAVPPALIEYYANAEKAAKILALQAGTDFMRGRELVLVPLGKGSQG